MAGPRRMSEAELKSILLQRLQLPAGTTADDLTLEAIFGGAVFAVVLGSKTIRYIDADGTIKRETYSPVDEIGTG